MANETFPNSNPEVEMDEKKIPEIIGYRRTNRFDVSRICQMIGEKTFDLFGDIEIVQVFEKACLSLVQINEEQEIVSNINLCNFPNIPSVPSSDWLAWIRMHYGVPEVTEGNTLFIHFLIWDFRYEEKFFKTMLSDVFAITLYCLHVIMIVPPGIKSHNVEMFDKNMTKIIPINSTSTDIVQTIYISFRHEEDPKLKIRRVVEEDNDDLIPIIDGESKILKELYGDYYISEIMRYSDTGNRKLIVAENDGQATGVMCLNRIIKLDLLIDNFELVPYNGLRKLARIESPISESISTSTTSSSSSSEITKTASEIIDTDNSKDRERVRFSLAIAQTIHYDDESDEETNPESSAQPILKSSKTSDRRSRITSSVNFESVLRTSVFADAINELPFKSTRISAYTNDEDVDRSLPRIIEEKKQNRSSQCLQGESNAFAIELFSMDKRINERHGQDYLEAAFECFPDLDYCVMLLPSTQPFATFLENFVRVPLRFDRDFPMVLYVTHRASLLSMFTSREAEIFDREMVVNFLQGISKKKIILDDFDEAITTSSNKNKSCYIFLCENQMIGLAIIRSESCVDDLSIMYNIDDYVSIKNTSRDAHARLLHFIVVPIFSVYHKLLFLEIMRLSFTTVLYYRLYDNDTTATHRTRPIVTCLDAMIPLKSRIRINDPYSKSIETMDEKFSLFITTPKLAMMSKSVVNYKIVVIGASDCGVAFAEYLAFQGSSSDIVNFTNVTIVSTNGIPFEGKDTIEHATMIPFRGRYCYDYRKVVPSRVWINVVHGIISHINRKEKYVVVSGLGTLSYDYLVLTCGLQYEIPNFRDNKNSEKNDGQENIPVNCFVVNDDVEAATCLERLKEMTNDFTNKKFIVIYGRNIDCHCALNNLLECGVKGSWIIMIEPKFDECEKPSDIFYEDEELTEVVEKFVRKSGVKIISGWNLKDWVIEFSENIDENENQRTCVIKTLRIESKTETKFVTCDALIYFGDRTMPMKTFMAISRAGLVFDGRLLIDVDYTTNDPCILAAGSFTKYLRKYDAENRRHQYYDSIEVGEKLAKHLKNKILEDSKKYEKEKNSQIFKKNHEKSILPVFRSPIIVYCRLPGGLNYLHVRKPGKKISRIIDIVRGTYGEVLITGSAERITDIGYFRIRLNQSNKIATITCLRKKNFRIQDLIILYGKHERILNNLKIRFQHSLIPDFFSYFLEPWAAALFHDKFDYLRIQNRATLLSKLDDAKNSLIEDIMNAYNEPDYAESKENYEKWIESKYMGSIYEDAISNNLINFLQREEEILPMYCNPRKLRRQLQGD